MFVQNVLQHIFGFDNFLKTIHFGTQSKSSVLKLKLLSFLLVRKYLTAQCLCLYITPLLTWDNQGQWRENNISRSLVLAQNCPGCSNVTLRWRSWQEKLYKVAKTFGKQTHPGLDLLLMTLKTWIRVSLVTNSWEVRKSFEIFFAHKVKE